MNQVRELDEQIVALSALMIAIDGVEALAQKGQWPQENFSTLLPSLIRFNAEKMLDYYDDTHRLEQGRKLLIAFLNRELALSKMRYPLQLMNVENKLSKNAVLLQTLTQRLATAQKQAEYYGISHENVLANFADIYTDTASKAANKILVNGSANLLQQQENINRIRTLLLCGVRACALWRASGGSRWQLILARSGIESRVKQMTFD